MSGITPRLRTVLGTVWVTAFVAIGLPVWATGARAEACPSALWPDSPVSRMDAVARVRFIQAGLGDGRERTRFWANAWGATWVAVTAGQIGISFLAADDDKDKYRVGAASSVLGLVPTWIVRPRLLAEPLPARMDGSCASVAEAERELELDADNDDFNTGVFSLVGSVATNLAAALVLGYGLGHGRDAVIGFLVGVPVGELMPLTYPRAAARLRARYVRGETESARESAWTRPRFAGAPLAGGAGVAVSVGF